MDATHRTLTWNSRRLVTTFVALTSAAVLAGGTGGYLIHGTTASTVSAPQLAVPAAAPDRAANSDSQSGYGAGTTVGAPVHAPNGDSQSGY